ncbi:MAG: two-component system sensor histidine kinase/response regulator, partial [Myxococcota bacterium]
RPLSNLITTLNDLADLSAIESDTLTLEMVPTDPARLVRSIADQFGLRAHDKGLSFVCQVGAATPTVLIDARRLRQALGIYLDNAIRFTAAGTVELILEPEPAGRSVILSLTIRDTGVGMSRSDLRQHFPTDYDAEVDASAGFHSSIAARLLQLMGARLSATSQPGVGTTIGFALASRLTAETAQSDGPDAAPKRNYRKRVLLAQSDPVSQELACNALKQLGIDVVLVATGREVIERLDQHPDLVIMDIRMAEMSGLEATSRLRERGFSGPIVAMTTDVLSGDIERYLATGMNGHIPKPFLQTDLVRVLDRFLG